MGYYTIDLRWRIQRGHDTPISRDISMFRRNAELARVSAFQLRQGGMVLPPQPVLSFLCATQRVSVVSDSKRQGQLAN
jgi:hypothetical protein